MGHGQGKKTKHSIEFLLNPRSSRSPPLMPSKAPACAVSSLSLSREETFHAQPPELSQPSDCSPGQRSQRSQPKSSPASTSGDQSKKIACPHCGKRLSTAAAVNIHRVIIHHDTSVNIPLFRCTGYKGCREVFTARNRLLDHVQAHKKPNTAYQYVCHVCGIRFRMEESLSAHHEWGHDKKVVSKS